MKRLIPIFAAVVALAGPLAAGGAAAAKDHQGGDRGERSSDRGGDRGGQRGGDRGGQRGSDRGGSDRGGSERGAGDRGGYERRGGDDRGRSYERPVYPGRGGPPQGYREGRSEPYRGDRRAYEYDAPPPQPSYAPNARRGGYMPPQAAPPVQDPGRYRLRPPPRGFTWVRTANGYAMVGQDGRVFDVVPY